MAINKKISLIDGSGFIFRAYYALPPLTSKNGTSYWSCFRVFQHATILLEEKKSDKVVVIFDTAKKPLEMIFIKNIKPIEENLLKI